MNMPTITRDHLDADRYHFDLGECRGNGWQQYDTDQDAWYFGVWVNPNTFEILTYAEGDVTRAKYEDSAGYNAEMERMGGVYGRAPAFTTVDLDSNTITRYYQDRTECQA